MTEQIITQEFWIRHRKAIAMRDRIVKELERLQLELKKGQEQREALSEKLRKTETQLVYIQGALHAMKLILEDEIPKESEDASE